MLEKHTLNCLLAQGLQLELHLFIMGSHHLVLGLLSSQCFLNVGYSDFESLVDYSRSFCILVVFQPFDVLVDNILWLDVLNVSASEIDISLFVDNLWFLDSDPSFILLSLNVRQGHYPVQLFDFVLNIKYVALELLLFLQPSQHRSRQLLGKIGTFFAFGLETRLSFGDHFIHNCALVLPRTFIACSSRHANFIPNRLFR